MAAMVAIHRDLKTAVVRKKPFEMRYIKNHQESLPHNSVKSSTLSGSTTEIIIIRGLHECQDATDVNLFLKNLEIDFGVSGLQLLVRIIVWELLI